MIIKTWKIVAGAQRSSIKIIEILQTIQLENYREEDSNLLKIEDKISISISISLI